MSDTAFPSQRVRTVTIYAVIRQGTGMLPTDNKDILITFLQTVIRISTCKCDLENAATYNIRLERAKS
jgi:hypothetical protein